MGVAGPTLAVVKVSRLADVAWNRVLRRDVESTIRLGGQVERLPRGGAAALADDVAAARHDLRALDALPAAEDWLLAAFLRDHLTQEVREAERFWYRFPVTPFNLLPLSTYREQVFDAFVWPGDVDRYLSLLDDYVAIVAQLRVTLAEQRKRGIAVPRWAVDTVVETVRGHAGTDLVPAPDRVAVLAPGPRARLVDGARRMTEGPLADAFAALLDDLTTHPAATGVGIGQYPGGAECYAGLVGLHTGLDLSPDQIHAIGLEEVARLTDRIRTELGVVDEAAHRARLSLSPPADVEALFQGHLDRLTPHLPTYFARLPAAPFRLRRLDPVLEGGLTYGFYEPPGADGCGYYHYNGANPPVLQSASLIYHEGLPGHHLQIGRQAENTELHPIRREPTGLRTFALGGYLEGWGEYAAGLCGEIGLYTDPVDAYGRLCLERFQAARLVVDTGMNVLGWSRGHAAAYLPDTEIGPELLRYAVDDPGQALGYHLGHWYLRNLRGDHDPHDFHELVLAEGPLPLTVLGEHVNRQRSAQHQETPATARLISPISTGGALGEAWARLQRPLLPLVEALPGHRVTSAVDEGFGVVTPP